MKKVFLYLVLALMPVLAFANPDSTQQVIEVGNVTLTVDKDASLDELKAIFAILDSTYTEGKEAYVMIKDKPQKSILDWMNLLFLLMPILTSVSARWIRVKNLFNTLIKRVDNLSIVVIIGTLISGFFEYINMGVEGFSVTDWGSYSMITVSLAIAFYEATKSTFGKTPKGETSVLEAEIETLKAKIEDLKLAKQVTKPRRIRRKTRNK